jgi:hypothetical protein
MAAYAVAGAGGAVSTTAAAAGIVNITLTGTLCSPIIYYWSIGPHANSADEDYTVRLKRATTAGTWATAVTPAPLDKHSGASLTAANLTSTAAGTASDVLGVWGYHLRGGYAWTAIPGGEFEVLLAANGNILLEWLFAQGTSLQDPTVHFRE